jgi:hypothetical protein
VLRHQLNVLRRRLHGRVRPKNHERWFLVQLSRWSPSILKVLTIIRPETLVRWHRTGFRSYLGIGFGELSRVNPWFAKVAFESLERMSGKKHGSTDHLEDGASVDDKGLDRADPISLTNSALARPGKTSTPAKCQHQNLSGQFYFGSQKSRISRANAHSKSLEGVEVLSGSKAKHPVLAQGRPRHYGTSG